MAIIKIKRTPARIKFDREIEDSKQIVFYFRMFLNDLRVIGIPDSYADWVSYIIKHRYNDVTLRADRATSAHRSHKPKGVSG